MFLFYSLLFNGIIVLPVDYLTSLNAEQSFIITFGTLGTFFIIDRYILKRKHEFEVPFVITSANVISVQYKKLLPVILFVGILVVDIGFSLIETFRSTEILYSIDRALFAMSIISQSHGLPPNDIGHAGLQTGLQFSLFPPVYAMGTIMAISDSVPAASIYLILTVNALIHASFIVIAFQLAFRISKNSLASVIGALAFTLGLEYYWLAQIFRPDYPYLLWEFNLYLGTPFPSAVIGPGSSPLPSVGILSFGKSFINGMSFPFAFILVGYIIYIINEIKRGNLRYFHYVLFTLLCIVTVTSHVVTGAILLFCLSVFAITEALSQVVSDRKQSRRMLYPIIPMGIIAISIIYFGVSSVELYENGTPGLFMLSLFYYTGPALLLAVIAVATTNIVKQSYFRAMLILFLLPFVLLYRYELLSSTGEWFSSQITFVMHTGLVLFSISAGIAVCLKLRNKLVRLASTGFVLGIVVLGIAIPVYQYYSSQVINQHTYWDTVFVRVSYDQLRSFEWIWKNTDGSDVVLIPPESWTYLPMIGRTTATVSMGIPPDDPRLVQVNNFFAADDLRGLQAIIDDYEVSYIYLTALDDEKYSFSERVEESAELSLVYSDNFAKIFKVTARE